MGFAIVVAVALAAIVAWWLRRRYLAPARVLARRLRAISADMLVNVIIPDGMGGEIHVDHLLLTADGLLLLDFKDVRGTVFAGAQLDTWTAMEPGSRITFDNPIPVLQDRIAAVSRLAPDVPIHAQVVFEKDAEFPKGHPPTVITFDALYEALAAKPDEGRRAAADVFGTQWAQIKAAAASGL